MNYGLNALHGMEKTLYKVAQETEKEILNQLNELIKRDLLVVEMGQMALFKDFSEDGVKVSQSVRLVLKNQEYVERLEKENDTLRKALHQFIDANKNAMESTRGIKL